MNKTSSTLLIAGLLSVAGFANAQVPTTMSGGAATTKAQGQINPVDKSPMTTDTTRAEVKSEAAMANKQTANRTTGKGAASTTGPNGQPNMLPAGENPATSGMATPTKDATIPAARMANKSQGGIPTGEKTSPRPQ